ncbi:unnamed protein product [Phyllotreta striolata]|uniref:U1-C C2H2-type zinc finger domain-containing protein n=1 Tax=Phyllotreta striolata TaxID=444603 RepID=A0A9N9TXJ4_PHYSR|nr:unnamed protein product [Phyllotreta striolata]
MGRRYYCDYCEKSFIDDIDARKKHLQSSNHVKLRHMHYEACRDPETILREELLKASCRRFFQGGGCPFEGVCRYTHYSPEQLCELRQKVENIQEERRRKNEESLDVAPPESWVQKYKENNNKEDNDDVHIFWSYPRHLESRTDLPPSLVKFKPEHFYDDNLEEWGN